MPLLIRPPRDAECAALTHLVLRSKAHWGYSQAFMLACVPELTLTPTRLRREPTWVAEDGGKPVGVFSLGFERGKPAEPGTRVEVALCFVAPQAIGRGVGRALWQAGADWLANHGHTLLHIDADPHAEPFYLRMGAKRVGEAPSTVIPGRMLPHLHYDVAPTPSPAPGAQQPRA